MRLHSGVRATAVLVVLLGGYASLPAEKKPKEEVPWQTGTVVAIEKGNFLTTKRGTVTESGRNTTTGETVETQRRVSRNVEVPYLELTIDVGDKRYVIRPYDSAFARFAAGFAGQGPGYARSAKVQIGQALQVVVFLTAPRS